MLFSKRLQKARLKRKISTADVAVKAGITEDQFCRLERGEADKPNGSSTLNVAEVTKLAIALDVPLLWLAAGKTQKQFDSMKTGGTDFSSRLRGAREGAGITVSELARRAGLSRQTITNWEGGKHDGPDGVAAVDSVGLMKVAHILDSAPTWLATGHYPMGIAPWRGDSTKVDGRNVFELSKLVKDVYQYLGDQEVVPGISTVDFFIVLLKARHLAPEMSEDIFEKIASALLKTWAVSGRQPGATEIQVMLDLVR